MKSPISYFGGKITLGPAIAALFPDHLHYVEPYCGSLAVLLAKQPSPMETVNDLDGALVTFWRVLRDRPAELERACALTPHSRAEYDAAQELDATDDVEVARQVWVKLNQGRAGRLRRSGWRRYIDPSGSSTGMPGYLDGYVDRLAAAAERLHHVTLENLPAIELIDQFGASPDVLLYVDPPYLGATRSRSDDNYRHEMRDEDQHRELAEHLRSVTAAVVLSGYPSDLYDRDLFPDWDRVEMAAGTGQGGVWANRTEVLWSNREISTPDLFSEVIA